LAPFLSFVTVTGNCYYFIYSSVFSAVVHDVWIITDILL